MNSSVRFGGDESRYNGEDREQRSLPGRALDPGKALSAPPAGTPPA
jgi:hypothetical protein